MCSSLNTLWSHLRTMHADEEGIKKPTCSICGEDFVRKYQLKKHMALKVGSYLTLSKYLCTNSFDLLHLQHHQTDFQRKNESCA